jgi:uncharacterized protein YgfB (UPF0149 family)
MLNVTFPEVARVLERSGSSISAAESHGCLCGALCTSAEYPLERWLDEIVPDDELASDQATTETLKLLFEDTVRALRGDQMEFQPLVPDDETALESRAAALAQWCQGFLYGFGTGRPMKPEQLSANVSEILKDLTQIGRASVEVGESGEEEEQAYAQIIEYVRAGVQLIHDELADARANPEQARPS